MKTEVCIYKIFSHFKIAKNHKEFLMNMHFKILYACKRQFKSDWGLHIKLFNYLMSVI